MSPTVEALYKTHGGNDFFATREAYEEFRIRFGEELRPKLEKLRDARRKSEEDAQRRYVA